MGEGLLACGGGAGAVECAVCCCVCGFLLATMELWKGSFDDAESGRKLDPALSGENDCCVEGSGFCPDSEGRFC